MTIDSILTEWSYRLPTGYPTRAQDYEVLYDVLLETAKITPAEGRLIVEHAKGTVINSINESLKIDSIENQFLLKAISDVNKVEDFIKFLSLLPLEAEMVTLQFLNNLSIEQSKRFANLLYSENEITEQLLNSFNFKSDIYGELFQLHKPGFGKGEILLTTIVRGSYIQGGTVSYDLNVNGKKYEVKDYSNPDKPNASIRLGTKGTVTRFRFWDEITTTFQRLAQLRGIDTPKFDLDKILPESLLIPIRYLESRREVILAGNLGIKDKQYLDQFYQEANKLESKIKGYTNIILRGPNALPVEMSIEPIDDASGDSFIVRPIRGEDGSQNLTYVNTELRRLKYVRNPLDLNKDMQEAVTTIVNDVTFIIFRRDRINVTQDVRYAATDAGKIRIIEKDITPSVKEFEV
jgi:hypothetical protein